MPPTTLFNIMCIAISFIAATTNAQLGNWDIIFHSIETDFQDSMTDEITLRYHVGTGRSFTIELLGKNCAVETSSKILTPTPTIARTIGVTPNHDEVEIKLIMDKSTITSLGIWDDNSLQFCVRVRILSGGSIIKQDQRSFTINFVDVSDVAALLSSSIFSIFCLGATTCIMAWIGLW